MASMSMTLKDRSERVATASTMHPINFHMEKDDWPAPTAATPEAAATAAAPFNCWLIPSAKDDAKGSVKGHHFTLVFLHLYPKQFG